WCYSRSKSFIFKIFFFFFQAEDGIRDGHVTGVQTCALPIFVGRQRGRGRLAALEGAERGLGGEPSRLDRVVDPLEARDVDHPDAVAAEEQAGGVQLPRQGVEAAARDRLRTPLHALAARQELPDLAMRLH